MDHWDVYHPLAHHSIGHDVSPSFEISFVEVIFFAGLMLKGKRWDQHLRVPIIDIINERDPLVFEMDDKHIVDNMKDWHRVTWKFDENLFLCVLFCNWVQLQLALIGEIKDQVTFIVHSY